MATRCFVHGTEEGVLNLCSYISELCPVLYTDYGMFAIQGRGNTLATFMISMISPHVREEMVKIVIIGRNWIMTCFSIRVGSGSSTEGNLIKIHDNFNSLLGEYLAKEQSATGT